MRGRGNQRSLRLLLPAALFVLSAAGTSLAQAPTPSAGASAAPSAVPSASASADAAVGEPPAEEPDAGAPEIDEVAQKHLNDGQAAAARGDWQAAYTSLRAGFAVQEHPRIVRALADAASHLGKHREVAELVSLYLRKPPADATAADRESAEKVLADARTRVGTLVIAAPDGAEVFVDKLFVGKAPLGRDVFVEPGSCSVEARSGNERGERTLVVEKGARTAVTLVYGVVSPPPPPTATASAHPTATASAAPAEGPRKEIVIGGAVLGGAALVAGAVLLGLSAGKAGEEQQARDALRELGTTNLCKQNPIPDCAVVKDAASAKDAFGNSGSALLIGGFAVGAATVGYYLIKKYSSPSPASARPSLPSVTAAGAVGPSGGAGFVTVRF